MADTVIVTAADERRRFEENLLPAFEEIAQTFLAAAPGDRGALHRYLDRHIEIGRARHRRRSVLLAVHDMKDGVDAPLALQSKTLAHLILLKVRPIPPLKHYRDIATAILRMEIVIRTRSAHEQEEAQAEGAVQIRRPLALQPHGPAKTGPWRNA